ncbi:MAG: hypothetical protein JJE37_01170 [Methyloceanibacter sp.]|jgi:hypothetical protein|nr:hypothetical protein [Methyloceanibacter sp.]
MHRPDKRFVFTLVAAGVVSALIGLLFTETVGVVPCEGEGLACNIDEAIGAYAVLIWAVLGPVIFAVTLLIARNRKALAGVAIVLVAPLMIFFGLAMSEAWRYVGFYPYKDLRTFLVELAPPLLTVLMQWLILRVAVPTGQPKAAVAPAKAVEPGGESRPPEGGSIPFPTE